jgi:NAD(P)-dependent dehydrogenase (short-subunit alcohol dehydrogenase family)
MAGRLAGKVAVVTGSSGGLGQAIAAAYAGVNAVGPAVEMAPEDWRRVIDTNLSGCFFGAQAAAGLMFPQRSGSIIVVGSILSETGLATRAP